MAGIGFELRKILSRDSYTATLHAYVYAGLISSGPWVLSILSVMLVGGISLGLVVPEVVIRQFLITVTYLMATSLILTGGLQLFFTRFVSDRLFERKYEQILPNLVGMLLLVTLGAGVLGILLLITLFDQGLIYRLLTLANFVVLCNLWLVIIFLSGMKAYNRILLVMLVGYGLMVGSAFFLRHLGMEGLLLALLLGHSSLLFLFLYDILREYRAEKLVAFDFLDRRQVFVSLLLTGLCYNLGIWIDKFIFWFNPQTSSQVIGPMRASILYDLPIFLAYLAIIPGMAVFLVRIETDFAEWYERLFRAVRDGETLQHIGSLKAEMTFSIRQGLLEICKVQGLTVVLLFLFGPRILEWLGMSSYYLPLFYIDLIGVSIQVVFMAILNVFFYLDKRMIVLELCLLFVALNGALTLLSLYLGPSFFGYGFTFSLLLCVLLGLARLSTALDDLEYETFMLSR
ncbi:exopolysaccharide Pel transporter PelG [Pseudomonas chlororaphis]|uniref:exopolysaccharide Pel transporter PelG n=1 Tax=Pseudomonas chlororaphis TaxID=587753 RepID=UPI0006A5AB06|nr:exopolysaccharide Pel transporter PelG [Pseudomonas chlororaphis]AZD02471.1 Pellicle/biofilm biosynthesis inner membrane protein PelG, MATE family transporter [Pseudomonas chlororaphis subsp. chlororaphis]MBM0280520.1 exopolysaccharide Pel transporter PelG [Pseudomonas chlororaphis]MDO1504840.1 exopolysaccharide Pel transporter PelG [Pseudomonas chlororaphis]ORM44409.1 histidine kinase [Pseudomonas chlororaphis subsp. chlororaphis]TWR95968.1 histidine kinase [Pseudomonas chlororaphis subsp.